MAVVIWLPKCLHWPFCPGVFIAILAFMAAAVTFRKEPGMREKAAWTFLFLALMCAEVWVMGIDRDNNEAKERKAEETQLRGFSGIGEGIRASITESDRNFTATIGKTNQVLQNITGGDAFAYVSPQNFSSDQFPGIVWNNGEQALVGLTLTIAHTSDPVQVWGAAFFKPIYIGTVGPHDHAPIPDFLFQPKADEKTGQDNYWIMLSAQNGTAQQSLYFRRNKLHPQLWAYSFQVVRQRYADKPQKERMLVKIDNTPRKGPKQELLLFRAWSDDMEAALQKH